MVSSAHEDLDFVRAEAGGEEAQALVDLLKR